MSASKSCVAGATYRLVAADLGKAVYVRVTGSKSGYSSRSLDSVPTKAIARGKLTSTPKPTITGSRKVARTLTAKATWNPRPVTLTYQWYRNGKAISGAADSSYRLVSADRGKRIAVKVTGTKAGYVTVSRISKETRKIS